MTLLQSLGVLSLGLTAAFTLAAYFGAGAASGHGQTRRGAIVEAWINVGIGFGVNYGANFLVLPLVGVHVEPGSNFWLGLIYTAISVVRSFVIRRWFEARIRRAVQRLAA